MQPNGTQALFARALLERSSPPSALRLMGDGAALERRFGIYRNNVFASLAGVLAARFPATGALLGAEFFRGMAAAFVAGHPPRSPVMLDYGEELPAFIETFDPARDYPYVADVARLEWAMHSALHAADSEPVAISTLHDLDPARLDDVALTLHPSVRRVASDYPVLSVWRAALDPSACLDTEFSGAESVLVTRLEFDVVAELLSPGAFAFLNAVSDGRALGSAADAAFAAEPGFDLAQTLALIFSSGAIAQVRLPHAH